MRLVMQIDFSTSVAAMSELGRTTFENDLTRLYLALDAKGVWSRGKPGARIDFVLCEDVAPRDLTSMAKQVYETALVRPVFFPQQQSDQLFGF
jgi:hypothetical protein